MKLTVLGCNGPFPAPGCATSGYLVTHGETAVELDLGSGTLGRLTERMAPEHLTALVLSHWHYDHCSDLLPLIYRLQSAKAVLDVYAPVDEASPVRRVVSGEACFRLHDVAPGDTLAIGDLNVRVFAARHPVPSVMLRLEAGRSTLCYTGDTNTTDELAAFAENAGVLLADAPFPESEWAIGKPHLSAAYAAGLAAVAHVKKLIVTHLIPLYDAASLLREAQAIRGDAMLASPGLTVDL